LPSKVIKQIDEPVYPLSQNEAQNVEKNVGRWTDIEHEKFLAALLMYGKDWTAIEKHVGSRDAVHIRSHA
jgi:SHAQKYF class myb-like DNA-binding protein